MLWIPATGTTRVQLLCPQPVPGSRPSAGLPRREQQQARGLPSGIKDACGSWFALLGPRIAEGRVIADDHPAAAAPGDDIGAAEIGLVGRPGGAVRLPVRRPVG